MSSLSGNCARPNVALESSLEVVRREITHYREARNRYLSVSETIEDVSDLEKEPELHRLAMLAYGTFDRAERSLIFCVLAFNDPLDGSIQDGSSKSIIVDDVEYVVRPLTEEGESAGESSPVFELTVVPD